MEKLQSMASRYYEAFEGIHLYPKFSNKLGVAWLLSMLLFAGAGLMLFTQMKYREPLFIILAIGFMFISALAENHRVRLLTATVGKDFRKARIAKLEQITGRPASEFLSLAQEASQLLSLQKQFTPQRFSIQATLYNASMKGQLLPIFIGLMGIFLVVFQKTFSIEPEDFFELFGSSGLWSLAAILLFLVLIVFFFGTFLLYAYSEFSGIFRRWRAKIGIQKPSARVELDYFLQHLISYHDPERQAEANAAAVPAIQPRKIRKPISKPRRFHRGLR